LFILSIENKALHCSD